MHDSRNIPFSEDFIKAELERHNLNPHYCANCSDAVKHFVDPKILADKIYAKNIPILPKIVVKFSILKTKKSDQIWWGFKQTLIMRCIVLFQDILDTLCF